MNASVRKLGLLLFNLILISGIAASSAFAAKAKTFTGKVSDAMCGAKHMESSDDAGCTRACVGKGAKYALVMGDKVYTLDTNDKDALAALDKNAGAKVTVTGTEKDGNIIAVTKVTAAP